MDEKRYRIISEYLLQILLIAIGIIIIGFSFYEKISGKMFSTLNGVGVSLLLSGLLGIFMNVLFYRKEAKYQVCEEWKITNIYESRAIANKKIDACQELAKKHVDIIAFGLTSWRQSKEQLIDSMLKKGVRIRIITIDPDSDVLTRQDHYEGKAKGSTKETILQLREFFSKTEDREKVEIRYHNELPLDFYFRVDDHVFVGPYLFGKESQQLITYEFEMGGQGFDYYSQYFEDLWTGKTVPKLVLEKRK